MHLSLGVRNLESREVKTEGANNIKAKKVRNPQTREINAEKGESLRFTGKTYSHAKAAAIKIPNRAPTITSRGA